PLKAELAQRKPQYCVRLLEHCTRRFKGVVQRLPHPHNLRTLSRENKCNLAHLVDHDICRGVALHEAQRLDFVLNSLVHTAGAAFVCHANCILDGFGGRPSMADNYDTAHTQQWGSAVLRIIHARLEILESLSREQCTYLGTEMRREVLFEERAKHFCQA